MRRMTLVGAVIAATLAIVGTPGAAFAGGGCHGGMTEADATGADEATIRMVDACFDASVLRVDPGTSVTFVNEDVGLSHNVGGTEWGFYGDLQEGDTFSATFDAAWIYPFACSYHPGMTGAIVVGDGNGAGKGWTVLSEGPFEPTGEEPPAAAAAPSAGRSSAPWIALAALGGLALGATATIAVRRTTKPAAA